MASVLDVMCRDFYSRDRRPEFLLFEHDYSKYPLGQVFTRARNYNHVYIPANLSAHVNSAILADQDTVLATVFTSGELLRIDRRTNTTEVVLRDLHRPHSVRRRPEGGYYLSDTEGGAVILLDPDLRREKVIPVATPWIQDAVLVGDRMMVVGNPSMSTDPTRTGRGPNPEMATGVLELALDGTLLKKMSLGPEYRLYLVEPLPPGVAIALADEWQKSDDDGISAQWETVR